MSTGSSSIIAWGVGAVALVVILWQGCEIADLREDMAGLSERLSEVESKAKRHQARGRLQPEHPRSLSPAAQPSSRFVPERLDDDPEPAQQEEARKAEVEAALEEVVKRRQQEKMDQWLETQLGRNEAKVQEAVDEGLVSAHVQTEVLQLLQGYAQAMWDLKTGVKDGEQSGAEAREQYGIKRAETHAALADLIGEDAASKLGPGPPRQAPGK
jgi:hypothetical protein